MTDLARSPLKVSSGQYEDALDTLRFFSTIHPEWKSVLVAIESYVTKLEHTVGLHEPGT